MQQEAIDVAQEAMNKFTVEKDIAMHIKKTVCSLPTAPPCSAPARNLN